MCTPAKRLASEIDVLDLSRKICSRGTPVLHNGDANSHSDVIVLSEDDEDKRVPLTSDTEKENDPFENKKLDGLDIIYRLEHELRQEETNLLLLQKLCESQKTNVLPVPNKSTPKSSTTTSTNNTTPQQNNASNNNQVANNTFQSLSKSVSSNQLNKVANQASSPISAPIKTPKVTKAAALQSLEQQCNAKKSVLRKQLERNLEKIALPRPTTGTGLCEVAFIPSTLTAEFTSLLGLGEVVRTIQDFDPSSNGKLPEPRRSFSPFSCVKCQTDFTPVWKREKPGSTNVICEACLAGNQRSTLQKEYEQSVKQILQQNSASERDVEREYQDIVTTPTKLDNYIKEQEKKLLATHQAQLIQQQQQAQHQATAQARYHKTGGVAPNTCNRSQNNHATANQATSNSVTHQRSRQAAPTPLTISTTTTPTPNVALPQQHSSTTPQFASQYQQLAKAAGSGGSSANTAALMIAASANPSFLAAAAAANNQQQQQQQQQRFAAVLSGLQQQQQQFQAASPDQFAQIQALMNNILCGGSTNPQANTNNRQQLIQQALQYNLLLQQQQAAAAQQAQQAAAQAQQNAMLTQLLSAFQTNPTAYLALLHNFCAMNASGNSPNGSGPANKK